MNAPICGIYRITCLPTGRTYVGQSVDVKARWKYHRRDLNAGRSASPVLQAVWNKYGPEAFEFALVEACSREVLTEREQRHIDLLGASVTLGGCNIAAPMECVFHDPKIRQKIRDTNKASGAWRTFEAFGKTGTLQELCTAFGANFAAVSRRVDTLGHSLEDALSKPSPRKSFEVNGEFDSLPNWCVKFGVPYSRVRHQLGKGMSLSAALGAA